jgi:hypothetical protein
MTAMSDFFADKFWDFIVNLLSVIAGGGAILAYIEWRRYQREKRVIRREEEGVAVDVVSSEIAAQKWELHEHMSADDKVRVYENQLQGTVKSYIILLEFVLRNTTGAEVVVTRLETEEPGVLEVSRGMSTPDTVDVVYEVYALQTGEYLAAQLDELIALKPNGTLGRAVWIQRAFDEAHKLETEPSSVVMKLQTSERGEVEHNIPLRNVRAITKLRYTRDGKPYYGRAATLPPRLEDPEIPF